MCSSEKKKIKKNSEVVKRRSRYPALQTKLNPWLLAGVRLQYFCDAGQEQDKIRYFGLNKEEKMKSSKERVDESLQTKNNRKKRLESEKFALLVSLKGPCDQFCVNYRNQHLVTRTNLSLQANYSRDLSPSVCQP